jgi:hypothetical protein
MTKYKSIPGYVGSYSISKSGKVRNDRTNKTLKWSVSTEHYPSVELWVNNKRKRIAIHILVALTYIGERPNGTEVMHLDGNNQNPALDNLRYGSKGCNAAFKIDHGTYFPPPAMGGYNRKLSIYQARRIREYLSVGITGAELARHFEISERAVNLIRHGRSYKEVQLLEEL